MHKTLRILTLAAVLTVAVLSFHAFLSSLSFTRNSVLADGAGDSGENSTVATAATETHKHTNHLVDETSPYLLQHAHNPVDWYPWADEAIQRARDEDKPIFLSIGYAACHWCHVMERESFEDEATAAILNEHFVSIKVDREERPDLDDIYMTAVQAMTGSGGWPMTVFLTPDLQPFYGGTYFPPEDKFGMPGFKSVLRSVIDAWNQRRDDVVRGAAQLTEHIRRGVSTEGAADTGTLSGDLVTRAAQQLAASFDATHGGFGPAPKFPSTFTIALLLREHAHTKDERLLDMATFTLEHMANGGVYDHLGGGFHRYSVDEQWLVPHFEKMLYDNALLSQVYLEAYQVTQDELFRRVAEETFAYVMRDMQDETGGFYSTEDADSEGQEGKFYVWRQDEILSVLDEEHGKLFCRYYSVGPSGNFSSHEPYHKGQNILHVRQEVDVVASEVGMKPGKLSAKLDAMRGTLLAERDKRVRPGLDDKTLASWNALMISALARGYQVLGNEGYRDAAVKAADFVLREMMQDGELLHTHRKGRSRFPGYLDDYAFLVVAFVDLYEATFDAQWLKRADELAQTMIAKFWDEEDGGFYLTSADHKNLIARQKPMFDGAEPSGNSMAALGLLRLAKLTDNADYFDKAEGTLQASYGALTKAPRGMLNALCAVDFYVDTPKEVAIAGAPGSDAVTELLKTLHNRFVPNKVVALVDPASDGNAELVGLIPLLESKELVDGQPAAYVCKSFTCEKPVTTPEAFSTVLGGTE